MLSRVVNGKTQWAYGNSDGDWIDATSWYEHGKNPSGTRLYKTYEDEQICQRATYINGDVQTAHAQWKKVIYTISYTLNGGSISGQKQHMMLKQPHLHYHSQQRKDILL